MLETHQWLPVSLGVKPKVFVMPYKVPVTYQLMHLLLLPLLLSPPCHSSNILGLLLLWVFDLLFPRLGMLFPHNAHMIHSLTSFRFFLNIHHLSEIFLATYNCSCSTPLTCSSPFSALFSSTALITN